MLGGDTWQVVIYWQPTRRLREITLHLRIIRCDADHVFSVGSITPRDDSPLDATALARAYQIAHSVVSENVAPSLADQRRSIQMRARRPLGPMGAAVRQRLREQIERELARFERQHELPRLSRNIDCSERHILLTAAAQWTIKISHNHELARPRWLVLEFVFGAAHSDRLRLINSSRLMTRKELEFWRLTSEAGLPREVRNTITSATIRRTDFRAMWRGVDRQLRRGARRYTTRWGSSVRRQARVKITEDIIAEAWDRLLALKLHGIGIARGVSLPREGVQNARGWLMHVFRWIRPSRYATDVPVDV